MKYEELKEFIREKMRMEDGHNYQLVMIRTLNQNHGEASKETVIEELHRYNPTYPISHFKDCTVFDVLQKHNVVKFNSSKNMYELLDYDQIDTHFGRKATITKLCDEKILSYLGSKSTQPSEYEEYSRILEKEKQLIFYGPPGTGKTYTADNFADWFVSSNSDKSNYQDVKSMSDQEFKDYVLNTIKELGKSQGYTFTSVSGGSNLYTLLNFNNEVRLAFVFSKSGKKNRNDVWIGVSKNVLQFWDEGSEENNFHVIVNCDTKSFVILPANIEQRYARYSKIALTSIEGFDLKDRYDFHMTITETEAKLPTREGTHDGKDYDCTEYLNNFNVLGLGDSKNIEKKITQSTEFIRKVTFHPSYSYEEFVEGIKPKVRGEHIDYSIENGIFKDICEDASKDPDNKYVLIIDEINRGNISKILGELITLIEADKRGSRSSVLAYSKRSFTVPTNLHIIGTMNTADRSLIQIDTALRRRFAFCELMPTSDLLKQKVEGISLKELLEKLNERIVKEGLREKQIGHSYFMGVNNLSELQFVFANKIVPLLQDYFFDDYKKLEEDILSSEFVDSELMVIKDNWKKDSQIFLNAIKRTFQL